MFNTLILSGGSYKGFSYIGVLRYLEQTSIRANIKNISACSAGSIFGFLMALGLTSDQMSQMVIECDVNRAYQFDIKSFMTGYGFCDFSKIHNILIGLLKEKGVDPKITFAELYQRSNVNLVVNATCLETRSACYFSRETSPEMEVLKAVQMSCSIPLLFVRVQHDGLTYLDGGLLDNLPVTPFKSLSKDEVLSIYLTENVTGSDLESLSGYLVSIINMVTTNYNKLREKIYYPDCYLVKICVPVNFMTFQLTNEQIDGLIESGYQQTHYYFSLWRAKYGFKYPNELKSKFKLKLKLKQPNKEIKQLISI